MTEGGFPRGDFMVRGVSFRPAQRLRASLAFTPTEPIVSCFSWLPSPGPWTGLGKHPPTVGPGPCFGPTQRGGAVATACVVGAGNRSSAKPRDLPPFSLGVLGPRPEPWPQAESHRPQWGRQLQTEGCCPFDEMPLQPHSHSAEGPSGPWAHSDPQR